MYEIRLLNKSVSYVVWISWPKNPQNRPIMGLFLIYLVQHTPELVLYTYPPPQTRTAHTETRTAHTKSRTAHTGFRTAHTDPQVCPQGPGQCQRAPGGFIHTPQYLDLKPFNTYLKPVGASRLVDNRLKTGHRTDNNRTTAGQGCRTRKPPQPSKTAAYSRIKPRGRKTTVKRVISTAKRSKPHAPHKPRYEGRANCHQPVVTVWRGTSGVPATNGY